MTNGKTFEEIRANMDKEVKKMKKTVIYLAATLTAAGALILSKPYLLHRPEPPKPEQYQNRITALENILLHDLDGNGTVDAITSKGERYQLIYVSPEFKTNEMAIRDFYLFSYAKPMPKELQDSATELKKSQETFYFNAAKTDYELRKN
ncbi:Uncharacterised protein [uncultured archaeon]|nr:Uncharacterised protein [uncultured archaeon]